MAEMNSETAKDRSVFAWTFRSKLPEHRALLNKSVRVVQSFGVQRQIEFEDGRRLVTGAGNVVRRKPWLP